MNGWLFTWVLVVALVAQDASAKRLGDGASLVGPGARTQQTSLSAPASPGAAGAPVQSGVAQPGSAGAAGVPGPSSRWAGLVGGMAAGLGLVWLASAMGLGEGLAPLLLLVAVLAVAVAAVVGLWRVRRGSAALLGGAGWALQGAGEAAPLRTYSPNNVGNDASARPWERATTGFDVGSGKRPEAAGSTVPGGGAPVPEGFDVPAFLTASKANFVSLQAAWDRWDMATLRSMMTDGMLAQIQGQLAEHERQAGGKPQVTEVVMLEARLIGMEQTAQGDVASVEFSGLLREDPSAGPSPFREVWSITRPVSGSSGWLVAGVQALQ